MSKPRVIAFYLPQYHPTPDNDKWWGKGFTEWTNVGKAKPLFRGHYQPKVPADLGYYDLRLPEVREAQAELAKEAGIYGFCYYHYWFGNGKEELELPFNEVLRLGKPDFPFMLCWANESWHKKFWNKDGKGSSREVLIEQTYPGEQDIIDHFNQLLPAFKDPRYIKIDGKPAFMIYKPFEFPDISLFVSKWDIMAKKNGLNGIYFIGCIWSNINQESFDDLFSMGFSAINKIGIWEALGVNRSLPKRIFDRLKSMLVNRPICHRYEEISKSMFNKFDSYEKIFPTLLPNWDHTPRSGNSGIIFTGSSPKLFKQQVESLLPYLSGKNEKIVFLKSWNEWGEGNYMEPDLKFGHQYIKALKDALS